MGTEQYGRYYWCIKVPDTISKSGEIYLHADEITVNKHGDLEAWHANEKAPGGRHQNLALAAGQWLAFYAASVMDGSAVAVDHWEGEVIR